MASKPSPSTAAFFNQVKGYVTWLKERFFTTKEVVNRNVERFGPPAAKPARQASKAYDNSVELANLLKSVSPPEIPYAIPEAIPIADVQTIRFHTKFKFKNPRKDQTETRGYAFDLPAGLSKAKIQARIRAAVIEILAEYFQGGVNNKADIKNRIGPISITRVEFL